MSDPSDLIPPKWPLKTFFVMSAFIFPLYFIVFIRLLRLRHISKAYNTTFYSILLQHCIADLLSMFLFCFTNCVRTVPGIREFYFNYQSYYLAASSYNHIYYFLYIRCTGIVFLSFQRYLVISCPTSQFTQRVQTASKLQIILVYWTVPTLISIVVLKDTNFKYDKLETMAIIADQEVIKRNTLMALVVVSVTCVICSLAYGALFYYVRKHTSGLSKTVRREVHLAFQVFALLMAFFVILLYYAFQNYYSQETNTGPVFYMRALYPVANGLLSYINPFCILFLNKDLRKETMQVISCHKCKVSEAPKLGFPSTSTKQPISVNGQRFNDNQNIVFT